MFCVHIENEGRVGQFPHIDLALVQQDNVVVLSLQRLRQEEAQADRLLPAESAHAPVTGVVQKGLGLALQHQHIRHVLHVPRHRHRPGDGILPKKCLLAEIQLEGKGDAGPGHMHDLLKIQSHSILLTWYRGYCSKKKRPCQILFFNFRKFMV